MLSMYSSRKTTVFFKRNGSTYIFFHSYFALVEHIEFLLTLKCWTNNYRLPVPVAAVLGKVPYICQLW